MELSRSMQRSRQRFAFQRYVRKVENWVENQSSYLSDPKNPLKIKLYRVRKWIKVVKK